MAKTFFVTGTDTGAGKTFVCEALLHKLAQQGFTTAAMKPVAAGCDSDGHNNDALRLQAAMTATLGYHQVNPVALPAAIAPHIAARQAGKRLSVSRLAGLAQALMTGPQDVVLIEGAGGWLCPLNSSETLADLAGELQTPVILVVGMRLGCLNHALLSAAAISTSGLPLAAWVANVSDPAMAALDANIAFLKQRLPAPCLGVVPPSPTALAAADCLALEGLKIRR